MLTRFIWTQLIVFGLASVVGITAMLVGYLQVPRLLGWGHISVTLELPAGGGLYELANVTYRGVEVGKVTAVTLTRTGAQATLSLTSSPRISAKLVAEVRSVSAVGEQYVDLRPVDDSPPYLTDGSTIPLSETRIPQPVGPMLDRVSALLGSIPKDKLHTVIDESFRAFNGAGYDLGSLLDSSARISNDANAVADKTEQLTDDAAPFLDAQARSADALSIWSRSLAGISKQLVRNDPQIRNILQTEPGAADEASRLLEQVKPTLPVLLANLISLGKVAVTYRPSLEQLLVLLPPVTAYYQSSRGTANPTGIPLGDFRIQISDPPACTVGYLPPSQWRSPADTTEVDTPDDLYCKLPQDSPIGVRGARNLPCMGHPGKRAPTVAICDSDKPYEPIAMRQHILGPYPLDPNLISQGIPPDARTPGQQGIFGPTEGTPPAANPSPPTDEPLPPPGATPAPAPPDGAGPVAAPSSYVDGNTAQPSVAVAHYDPRTGRYSTPDGSAPSQTDLVTTSTRSWKDMILTPSV
jgi:phospholipid/cholesterol/gamma-HCH transport system substrate-binding protein